MEFSVFLCYSFLMKGPITIIDAQDPPRIILINGSRLLSDLLRTVICKADHLEMVQEVSRYEELPAAIENTEADWVLMSLPFNTDFPGWVEDHLAKHPSMRFLALFIGIRKVRLRWLGSPEEHLEDPTLDDLIQVLEGHPQRLQSS